MQTKEITDSVFELLQKLLPNHRFVLLSINVDNSYIVTTSNITKKAMQLVLEDTLKDMANN